MPYIPQNERPFSNPLHLDENWDCKTGYPHSPTIRLESPGQLNFAMTILAGEYVRRRGISYTVLNEVVGVFASAMAEFQRRVVAPYEDKKCAENGDVYDCLDPLLMHIPEEIEHAEPDNKA